MNGLFFSHHELHELHELFHNEELSGLLLLSGHSQFV